MIAPATVPTQPPVPNPPTWVVALRDDPAVGTEFLDTYGRIVLAIDETSRVKRFPTAEAALQEAAVRYGLHRAMPMMLPTIIGNTIIGLDVYTG